MDDDDPVPSHPEKLDVEAEEQRLDELGQAIDEVAHQAEDDLEVGGANRTFTDNGVRSQVDNDGDTTHPPADR